MNNTVPMDSVPVTEKDCENSLDRMFVELGLLKAEMVERQRRIELLRADTETKLAALPAALFK